MLYNLNAIFVLKSTKPGEKPEVSNCMVITDYSVTCDYKHLVHKGISMQGVSSGRRLWVDFDFGCSKTLPGQKVATVAPHQPGELTKYKSTKPRSATI